MKNFSVSVPENTTSTEIENSTDRPLAIDDWDFAAYPWIFINLALPTSAVSDTAYQRRNGDFSLVLSAGGYLDAEGDLEHFLPYGRLAREILMYLVTAAVRAGSPIIELSQTYRGLMRDMGIPYSSQNRAAVIRQLRSLLSMSITLNRFSDDGQILESERFPIGTGEKIRFAADGTLDDSYRSVAILSEKFFQRIMEDSTVTTGVMYVTMQRWRQLQSTTRSPLAGDIYLWLAGRLPRVGSDTRISWEQLKIQFSTEGASEKRFREKFREGLAQALNVYPEARVSEAGAGARTGFRGIILHPLPQERMRHRHTPSVRAESPTSEGVQVPDIEPAHEPVEVVSVTLYRGVDLDQLQQDLTSAGISTGQVSEARLQRAVAVVLSRASSPISTPQRYVTTALITDPTLLEAHTLTAAQIRTTPQDTTAAAEAAVEATPPTGGICQVCQDAYSGAVCPSCAAELISADPIPAETLTTLWQAVQEQLQQAGHTPGSALHERYSAAVQWHRDHQQI